MMVEVAGGNDLCAWQMRLEDRCGMQGAIAFAWTHININTVKIEFQAVHHYGSEDGTVDPGETG